MLFMTLNLTKSVFISLPFLLLYFSHQKEKLISPNSQKSNFLLTETTRDTSGIICVLSSIHKLINSPKLSSVKQQTKKKEQWTIKLTVNQILKT